MLDPSFKQRVFSAASAAMAKKILTSEYESITSEQDLDPPTSKCQRVQQNGNSKSLLWQFCDEIVEEKSDSEVSPESLEYVVDTY